MPEERQRRAAAEPRDIEEISPQSDIRVRIVGTVLSKSEDSLTLDDGTGSTEVFLEEDLLEEVDENDRIRVLGRVLPTPDSFEIQGEIVQDFSSIDSELHNKVKKVVNTSQ